MPVSGFLDRKLSCCFRTYDGDGDGFLERADFEGAVVRVCEEFGHGPQSNARQRLLESALSLWDRLAALADRDGEGRISEAGYKTAFAAGFLQSPASFDAGYLPFLNVVMGIADTDHDGRLEESEQIRWTGALIRLPAPHAREVFRRLDADGDGRIDVADLLGAVRAFYFDETPGSVGEWLLGPLDAADGGAGERVLEVAAADVGELEGLLRAVLPEDLAEIERHSDYRDFSLLEVVFSSVTSGVVALAIDTIKDYVRSRTSAPRKEGGQSISIRFGEVTVRIDSAADQETVERELSRLDEPAGRDG